MIKKFLISLILIGSISTIGYYTHRLWVFAGKVSDGLGYTYAAIDCLIQESGQNESDIDIVFRGFKTREAYYKAEDREYPGLNNEERVSRRERRMYNTQIPECKVFYSEHRCWMLDWENPKSLKACGLKFGLLQSEIDKILNDPKNGKDVMDSSMKRQREEYEKAHPDEK